MAYVKPLPEVREENKPFWEGLKEHKFLLPRCENGHYNWPPLPACRTCLTEEQEWVEAKGTGKLFSYTVVHRGPGAFNEDVPYVIALVKLDEEPRSLLVLGNTVDTDPAALAVDMPMKIAYEDIEGEDVTLWKFVVDGEAGS